MEREELAAWLRLVLTPGVGSDTARRLLAAFGLPQAIFDASSAALQQLASPAQVKALHRTPESLPSLLETTWQWLGQHDPQVEHRLVTLADATYPASLLEIEDPPLMLYLLGRTSLLDTPFAAEAGMAQPSSHWPSQALAMVGSRNPTPQGQQNAQQFAKAFSASGLCVVSGMALGIDGAAHLGALSAVDEAAPAKRLCTIAVIGTGIDRVYPRQHRELAHRIARHGLIVSEYPLGTPPLASNFPKRNRLIAGLSQGTLVVEAALASGSLITARLAAEQGKEVFAIPGSIHNPQSRGCHALIRQGAKLVETAQDVQEELRWPSSPITDANPARKTHTQSGPHATSDSSNDTLLHALGTDPVGLDALLARTGLDTATLQARLLELELNGQVGRLPGGLFQRLWQG
ncbi:MAG: DNA-processing protein DprA [Pseudomonadota bacterium]|nr:DNA-processing protein DprA [Pseudomonadota bacterium]